MEITKENIKDEKQLITDNILLGALAMAAVRQSPYICPDNLKTVLEKTKAICDKEFKEGINSLRMKWFNTHRELSKWLKENLSSIPELVAWNDRKNGNKAPFGVCSRYDQPHPDDDFIDLDALYGNIACTAWNESLDN